MAREDVTLGLLAGGRGTRIGGADKAWLLRGGVPQVLRWERRFAHEVAATLVSANRDLWRYEDCGLLAVPDRTGGGNRGPMAGLDALLSHCETPWLLTLPVDLVGVNECLVPTLVAEARGLGSFAQDDNGPQPLVALWHVAAAAEGVADAFAAGDPSIQHLQQRLAMHRVRFAGVRFGNLNTPADLLAAGIDLP